MAKSSQTIIEAQENGLFISEFTADKTTFQLDSGLVFTIKNAWVENTWRYECINNNAELVKDSSYQLVIDAEYVENNHLGAILRFGYLGQDTLLLNLHKDTSYTLAQSKELIDAITFTKRQVSR